MIGVNGDYSVLGWIDFSSEHREKVKTVIDLLHVSDVVDELGIGTIRDCFSDTLFPGISTIQTRAKYFLTIPILLKEYLSFPPHFRRKHPLADWLNDLENQAMKCLYTNHRTNPQSGIIGVDFAEKPGEVQRKPSSVYWNGLRLFGLVKTKLSLAEFLRKFANPDAPLLDLIEGTDDTKGDDRDAIDVTSLVVAPPTKDEEWKEHLTLHLSFEEATFLAGQITTRVPSSLLGQILMDSDVRKEFVELSPDWQFHEFCDEASFIAKLDEPLRTAVYDARDFWRLLEGAHIRYNVLLQARHGTRQQRKEFEGLWDEWSEDLKSFPWDRWDTNRLWNLAIHLHRHVKNHTRQFVTRWVEELRAGGSNLDQLDVLVTQQERLNKGARSRLKPNAEGAVSKWIGISSIDYRYPQARTIIRDMHIGLARQQEEPDAGL
jgi:hypothetical protein